MPHIVFVTQRAKEVHDFTEALYATPGVCLDRIGSGAAALDRLRTTSPHLVIVDASLPDTAPLELVKRLIAADAMVNTAVVSPLSDAEFHEAGEGLGILARLPEPPGAEDARDLVRRLNSVLGPVA